MQSDLGAVHLAEVLDGDTHGELRGLALEAVRGKSGGVALLGFIQTGRRSGLQRTSSRGMFSSAETLRSPHQYVRVKGK